MKACVFGSTLMQQVELSSELSCFDSPRYAIFPGFCDVHVHFREPGFSYKETVRTGSLSAARGGYTAVCTMPNLNPVPDSVENLNIQRTLIENDACIHVYPYGAITVAKRARLWLILKAWHPMSAVFPMTAAASRVTI